VQQMTSCYNYIDEPPLVNTAETKKALIGVRFADGVTPLYIDGLIDDVRIYDRALGATEIQTMMHTQPDADDLSLVAYWDFDDGAGQTAYDVSGNGHNGTLGSTPDADDSDPVWIESDAPVGICSLEGIVQRNLTEVRNKKRSILEQLYETMTQEENLWDYMDTVFADRDFGETNQGDVAKAKQKIMGAVQAEEQAKTTIDQSLDKIDDAMDALDIEPNTDRESQD